MIGNVNAVTDIYDISEHVDFMFTHCLLQIKKIFLVDTDVIVMGVIMENKYIFSLRHCSYSSQFFRHF